MRSLAICTVRYNLEVGESGASEHTFNTETTNTRFFFSFLQLQRHSWKLSWTSLNLSLHITVSSKAAFFFLIWLEKLKLWKSCSALPFPRLRFVLILVYVRLCVGAIVGITRCGPHVTRTMLLPHLATYLKLLGTTCFSSRLQLCRLDLTKRSCFNSKHISASTCFGDSHT